MTQSSAVGACSRGRSGRGTSRRRRGRKRSTPPCTLSASNTCSGRPRSTVKKLVTSTSALIGRRPMLVSRVLQPVPGWGRCAARGSVRPSTQGQASGNSISHADRAGEAAGDGRGAPAASAGRGRPRRGRARRRARESASPRLGVTRDLDHRVVEPGLVGVGRRRPARPRAVRRCRHGPRRGPSRGGRAASRR